MDVTKKYEQWHEDFQVFMNNARTSEKNSNLDDEFAAQQRIYSKWAQDYDEVLDESGENYQGYNILADYISETMDTTSSSLKVLDFGCGTGLLGKALHVKGFKLVDGLEPNEELLSLAKKKCVFRELFASRGFTSVPKDQVYDIIASSGVFFLSASHPNTDVIVDALEFLKPGGSFIILTKNSYLSKDYVNWDVVKKLEADMKLKEVCKKSVPGYRKVFKFEDDPKSMAAIIHYEKSFP